jgi:hypothetical protein
MPPNVRSGGLRPDAGNVGIREQRDFGSAKLQGLIKLTETLDPLGTGPMAQLVRQQEVYAKRVAEAAFQQDHDVNELTVIQSNKWLIGAAPVVRRHLDRMRGEQAGLAAVSAAEIEASRRGLDGQDPTIVGAFYNEARESSMGAAIESEGLQLDGREAFGAAFAQRERTLNQKATIDAIERQEADQLAAMGSIARSKITHFMPSSVEEQQPEMLALTFSEEMREAEMFGRDPKETTRVWELSLAEYSDTPGGAAVGSAPYDALLEHGGIVDPEARARLAAAGAAAAARRLSAEGSARKQLDDQLDTDLRLFKQSIVEDTLAGRSREETNSRAVEALEKLHPEIQGDAFSAIDLYTRKRATFDSMTGRQYDARLRQATFGELSPEEIATMEGSDDQIKSLQAARIAFDKGAGILDQAAFKEASQQIAALGKARSIFDEVDPRRIDFINDASREFRMRSIQIAAADPSFFTDPAKQHQIIDSYIKSIRQEADKLYPRDKETTKLGTSAANEAAEEASIQEEARLMRQLREDEFNKIMGERTEVRTEVSEKTQLIEPTPNVEAENFYFPNAEFIHGAFRQD